MIYNAPQEWIEAVEKANKQRKERCDRIAKKYEDLEKKKKQDALSRKK